MRRGLLLIATLTSAAALAGWHTYSVDAGSPQDIVAPDAGVLLYTSTAQVELWLVSPDGGTRINTMPGTYAGAGLFGGYCIVAANTGSHVDYSSAACGTMLSLGSNVPLRCALAQSGYLAITVGSSSSESLMYAPLDGGPAVGAPGGPWLPTLGHQLSYETIGGVDIAVAMSNSLLERSINRGAVGPIAAFPSKDLSLTTVNGVAGLVGVTTAGAVSFSTNVVGALGSLAPQGPAGCKSATFTEAGGDSKGRGFGMVTTLDGGVHSPIPDPSNEGLVWVQRNGTPGLTNLIRCVDSSFCVAIGPGANEVSAYFNEFAPVVVPPTVMLVQGMAVPVSVTATDPDGDPVFVSSWSVDGGLVTVADGGNGTSITVTATDVGCDTSMSLSYVISDGLASHVTPGAFMLPVQRTAAPPQPALAPATAEVPAGSGVISVSDLFTVLDPDGGCGGIQVSRHDWTAGGQAGPLYSTPDTQCTATSVPVTVTSTDPLGTSAAATATLRVVPWGLADVPRFQDGGTQLAGTTKLWPPIDQGHACVGTSGFPGTSLAWVSIGPLPPSTSATGRGDGLLVTSTDVCTSATFQAQAVRYVDAGTLLDGGTLYSDAGVLLVTLVPDLSPIPLDAGFSMGFAYDAVNSRIGGTFTTGATCATQRALSAEVQVVRDGGALVTTQLFQPVPGPWQLVVPGSCNGGDFVATARLFEDGGATGLEDRQAFTTTVLQAAPDNVTPSELQVSCGLGGRGSLTAHARPGTCQAVDWTWRQLDGPELDAGALTGDTIEVQTVELGFEALAQTVRFEVEADAGAGNGGSIVAGVHFTTDPFLVLRPALTPRPAREEEPTNVTLTIRNPTACEVHGVEVRLTLIGLTPIVGSVQLDGQPLEASVSPDGILHTSVIDVPAGNTPRTLRLRAVPRLMSRPNVTAEAWVGDVVVSMPPPASTPPGGCGCGAGGGGSLALALLALLALRRRAVSLSPGSGRGAG